MVTTGDPPWLQKLPLRPRCAPSSCPAAAGRTPLQPATGPTARLGLWKVRPPKLPNDGKVGLELSNTVEACDILSTTKRMVESLFSHGMFTTYCGFFGSPAPVNRWFIPLQSHYLPCFIVPNSYPAWCRISHPQRWPRSCTAWLNPPLKSLETWMSLDEHIETCHGSAKGVGNSCRMM